MERPTVIGVDVGLSFISPTTGMCRTTANGGSFMLAHVYADRASRLAALGDPGEGRPFDLVAIDGPLVPTPRRVGDRRSCERVFVCSPFQRRCKPGESHVRGSGQALKRAASDTAGHVATLVSHDDTPTPFPRVIAGNIIEAFPNAFLGVLLPDEAFARIPKGRGKKFDALFELVKAQNVLVPLLDQLEWADDKLRDALATNAQHDERAALICALTGVCVWQGRFTAVGDQEGGWFFLPPWNCWQPWAQHAIEKAKVDIWRDGVARPTHQA